jgi:hypothetical protein
MTMMLKALRKVFASGRYITLVFAVGLVAFAFAVWLPNLPLIVQVMGHSGIPVSQKIGLPLSLLGSITTNFTPLSASYTIAIAVLLGMNVAMLVYYLRRRIADVASIGLATGFLGMTSGVLGMGCAACGSLLLTSTFSLLGASGILAILPLAGGEFGILGVILLTVSLYLTAKRIQDPAVCRIT